jgi:hypothetical protein
MVNNQVTQDCTKEVMFVYQTFASEVDLTALLQKKQKKSY